MTEKVTGEPFAHMWLILQPTNIEAARVFHYLNSLRVTPAVTVEAHRRTERLVVGALKVIYQLCAEYLILCVRVRYHTELHFVIILHRALITAAATFGTQHTRAKVLGDILASHRAAEIACVARAQQWDDILVVFPHRVECL